MPGLQNSKSTLDFLGTIGSKDRGDNVAMGNIAKALVASGQFLIDTATDNLQREGNIASGQTSKSMKLVNINVKTMKMSVDVEILSTYKFLDQGVRGTQGGSGKYSFKTKYPNKKMALSILKWARKRGMSGRIKYTPKGASEAKNVSIRKTINRADNLKSLAYAISTNIKKKGIRPTKFFTDAVAKTRKHQKELLGKAFKLDVIETLNGLN